jgi:hypothetical protein
VPPPGVVLIVTKFLLVQTLLWGTSLGTRYFYNSYPEVCICTFKILMSAAELLSKKGSSLHFQYWWKRVHAPLSSFLVKLLDNINVLCFYH